ncbi:nibrin isoform X1, partial [Arapaima gigas]
MWTLSPLGNAGPPHRLLPGQEYTVGRTNCWILLHNDQSISRAHAVLCVGPTSRTQDQAPTLTIKDTSKYGTFVNEARLDSGTPRVLQHGDLVTFGIFQSKFRVEYEALIVCSSCVGSEGKVSLTQDIQELGGRLVSSWSQDCTHLVMPAVKVTIKTICALLCCRPIVKPDFFSEFRKALQQKTAPPKAG